MGIRSEVGRGTVVELWLPQAVADPIVGTAEADGAAPEPASATRPLRVLLVDDDALVRVGAAAMLEDLGHLVVEAPSGAAAIEILDQGARFDVVVTDHAMPTMTGAELARNIKSRFRNLPIVLATGYAEIRPEESALCDGRLSKPFTMEQLASAITEVHGSGGGPDTVLAIHDGVDARDLGGEGRRSSRG
jgi:CheY-like chemotaxis protein